MSTRILDETSPAIQHLCKKDKRLAKVIQMVGSITYEVESKDPYAFLVHEIIEQMLSVKAGVKIYGRLKGLCNGEVIPEKIAQALVSKQNFSLIMLKIDNLAKLRNSTNVKTANKALKQIGAVIEKDLRGSDMIARYNEEKFVIFLSNSDEKGAKVVAGRITDNIKKIQFKISSKDKITFLPIMGACTSKTAKALSDLIRGANKAIDEVSPKSKIKIQFCKNK